MSMLGRRAMANDIIRSAQIDAQNVLMTRYVIISECDLDLWSLHLACMLRQVGRV